MKFVAFTFQLAGILSFSSSTAQCLAMKPEIPVTRTRPADIVLPLVVESMRPEQAAMLVLSRVAWQLPQVVFWMVGS